MQILKLTAKLKRLKNISQKNKYKRIIYTSNTGRKDTERFICTRERMSVNLQL